MPTIINVNNLAWNVVLWKKSPEQIDITVGFHANLTEAQVKLTLLSIHSMLQFLRKDQSHQFNHCRIMFRMNDHDNDDIELWDDPRCASFAATVINNGWFGLVLHPMSANWTTIRDFTANPSNESEFYLPISIANCTSKLPEPASATEVITQSCLFFNTLTDAAAQETPENVVRYIKHFLSNGYIMIPLALRSCPHSLR